jgi:hypothetical protein
MTANFIQGRHTTRGGTSLRYVLFKTIAAAGYQGRDAFTLQDFEKASIVETGVQTVQAKDFPRSHSARNPT